MTFHQPAVLFRFRRLRVCRPASRLFSFVTVRALSICDSSVSAAMFLIKMSSNFITVSGENVSERPSITQLSIAKTAKLSTMTFIATCKDIRITSSFKARPLRVFSTYGGCLWCSPCNMPPCSRLPQSRRSGPCPLPSAGSMHLRDPQYGILDEYRRNKSPSQD